MARNFTLNFPATAFGPCSTTAGPTFVNHGISGLTAAGRVGLAFDAGSTEETAVSGSFFMPAEYTGSGTLYAEIGFYCAANLDDASTVAFAAGLEALATDDSVDMEASGGFETSAFTTAGTSVTVPATAGHRGIIKHELTAAFKDGVSAGEVVRLAILRCTNRSPTDIDTEAGDVYVACVSLYEET